MDNKDDINIKEVIKTCPVDPQEALDCESCQ